MKFDRQSGILLHPTSLPGPYGIGEIGPEARSFADCLKDMGQKLWQVLPLGPTSYGDSPYQALSTFAGNHLLISFDDLKADGLLLDEDLKDYPQFSAEVVDYGPVIESRMKVLRHVCFQFMERAKPEAVAAYHNFVDRHRVKWLYDYALYMAIKESRGGKPWYEWEQSLIDRDPAALEKAAEKLATNVHLHQILQFLFYEQWHKLREHCNAIGIQLIGDIPIFVAHDSADVWANQHGFYLDDKGNTTVIAGVPPDYFSATGQRWGNPLYRWDQMKANNYQWWKDRVSAMLQLVDIIRIDHFRGFEAYWEIPGTEETAINGKWVKGPGMDLFRALRDDLGELPILAEDLGIITEEVKQLRLECGFPGMRILQFIVANDDNEPGYHPNEFPNDCVSYTGTHDNDTTVGWYQTGRSDGSPKSEAEIAHEQHKIRVALNSDGTQIHWDLIKRSMHTNADLAITPMQDLLGLGTEHRMNQPGRASGNWRWRLQWSQITETVKTTMTAITHESHRA